MKKKFVKFSIRVEQSVVESLNRLAEEFSLKTNEFVRLLLEILVSIDNQVYDRLYRYYMFPNNKPKVMTIRIPETLCKKIGDCAKRLYPYDDPPYDNIKLIGDFLYFSKILDYNKIKEVIGIVFNKFLKETADYKFKEEWED